MNRAEIIQLLGYCASSYRPTQPQSPHTCTAMINQPQSDAECFLRLDGETLWIVFRGTASPRGWRTNLAFCKKTVPYESINPKIRVHEGFLSAYKSPEIRGNIYGVISPEIHTIKISGHSQGAALAVLCAVDLQYHMPHKQIEVVLFGCPRVGNAAFARSYNKRVDNTIRVENGNDIVTKLPPRCFGYRHVGARLHIGRLRLPGAISAKAHHPTEYYAAFLKQYMP